MIKRPRRILLIKTHALGDLLLATPAIHRIRKGLPEAHIALLTTVQCEPLVLNNPDIDEVIALPGLGVGPRTVASLMRARAIRADLVVAFQISRLAHLVARCAGAGEVRVLKRDIHGIPPWPPSFQTYAADAYQCLVEQLVPESEPVDPKPRLFVTETEKQQILSDHEISRLGARGYVVVAPGGGSNLRQTVAEKRWPAQHFGGLCDLINEKLGLETVIVGSKADLPSAQAVIESTAGNALNMVGRTDLRFLAALVNQASLVVCNDSVVLHMAVALGTPLVGLFGPTSVGNFLPSVPGPYVGVSSNSPCSPCYGNSLFPGCKLGTAVCMDEIPLARVFQACKDQLP